MAENGRDILEKSKTSVDKDTRIRGLKDKQNEERQKKLEEIKAQAFAAQRFKDQKEHERRRRLEELRVKDDSRRQQVEERKRAINDAERDRLESILRRNQEREHRIEAKRRNERSNIVFAFGSSTPRMLDPTDLTLSFWGHRRATSTQNITCSTSSLTRRQSERDLDVGNKKRATSATGLERSGESSSIPITPAGCVSGYPGRRRTDLVPTVPSRDSSFASSRKSLNHSPGRAYSMSRLDQLAKPRRRPDLPSLAEANSPNPRPLSSSRISSVTRSMSHLAVSKSGPSPTRRTLNKGDSRSMHHLAGDGVLVAPRTTRTTQLREQKLHASSNCSEASSRPSSSLSQQSTNSVTSSVSVRQRSSATPRRPRPASIAVTGITHDLKNSDKLGENKPPLPKTRKSITRTQERVHLKNKVKSPVDNVPKDKISESIPQTVVVKEANQETIQKPPDTSPVIQQKPAVDHPPEKTEVIQPIAEKEPKEDSKKEDVPRTDKSDIELVSEIKAVEGNKITEESEAAEAEKKQETKTAEPVQVEKLEVQYPQVSQVPQAPQISQVPQAPQISQVPQAPQISQVPETPQTSQVPQALQISQVPEALLLLQAPQAPQVPVPQAPQVPHAPQVLETPQAPQDPEAFQVPQATQISQDLQVKSEATEDSNATISNNENNSNNEMSTSVTKVRINTEEEAKAALAERRRLIREEAERQAELERLRIEAEAKAELERQQREEEQVRQLIELQRQTEQERLKEAIRETQKREEEERLRKEEEQRLKLLKEEAEKKAKEDAERQKAELQERLKNEEKEREARRKRVEAIMLRTRGKNNANLPSQQSADDKNENKSEESKLNEENVKDGNKLNEDSKVNGTQIVEKQENGTTKNGKDVDIVDNIIPADIVKNANTVMIDTMNSTDTINSNNSWQDTQQYDSLM